MQLNKIYNMDCIVGMQQIPDKSIDMILCDLPYQMTECIWDKLLPMEDLWNQYKRVIKDNGAIVLTCAQPFTTDLISSNRKMFRYCWYWNKNQVTGFPFAKFQPLRCVEEIAVFYKKTPVYNPQGLIEIEQPVKKTRTVTKDNIYDVGTLSKSYVPKYTNYPRQTLDFKCQREGLHPTQKPVALFEYLIKTYTNEGEVVLDNCMGSGTTAIACINTKRDFIGFEIDKAYFSTANKRIEQSLVQK